MKFAAWVNGHKYEAEAADKKQAKQRIMGAVMVRTGHLPAASRVVVFEDEE